MPAAAEADGDSASAVSAAQQPLQAAFGDPVPGLTAAQRARFDAAKAEFAADEGPADGLGPVFNDTSCARCHGLPAIGGGSNILVTRFGTITGGRFDPLASKGGSLKQDRGIGQVGSCFYGPEPIPPEATIVSHRRTQPLFGLGLVDAVPESTFHLVALLEAIFYPAEAGRVAHVFDISKGRQAVGRFGWKSQVPTLHQFSGDAYLNEMGVTNPEFPDESCPGGDCALLACNPRPDLNDDGGGVAAFTDFMTMLAPPPRPAPGPQAVAGKRTFDRLGCARCHWSTLATGKASLPALSGVVFHPYSDFLLHDMGRLGDGVEMGDAKGSEFRTAPLWGLSQLDRFLHDGRATTLPEAILAHDGQARRSRDRFAALPAAEQAALVAFLRSL